MIADTDILGADPADRPSVHLMPGGHRRAVWGHPWVFSNEIRMDAAAKALAPGTLVRLVAEHGEAIGARHLQPAHTDRGATARACIRRDGSMRLLCRPAELVHWRRASGSSMCRSIGSIHAEADGLPGLIIDRYGAAMAVQANTAGMEGLTPVLLEALDAVLSPGARAPA